RCSCLVFSFFPQPFFPQFTCNHAILVYKQKSLSPDTGIERYAAYDPNHPESPRELTWIGKTRSFAYQKDVDFVGGFVRVYQVYGKWLQYRRFSNEDTCQKAH